MHDSSHATSDAPAWISWLRWLALIPGMIAASILSYWALTLFFFLLSPAYGVKTNLSALIEYVVTSMGVGAGVVLAAYFIAPRYRGQTIMVAAVVVVAMLLVAVVGALWSEDYLGVGSSVLMFVGVVLAMLYLRNRDDA